jgi:beta-lactamase regulating signal transducer with metallopeptidase domain
MIEAVSLLLGPDPLAGLAAAVLYVNLAVSAALVVVIAARLPLRRLIGPQAAYKLWILPLPAAGLALGLFLVQAPEVRLAPPAPSPALLAAWAAGAGVVAGLFGLAQARFARELRRGLTGPAVVGLISPRIVMPADDGRYTPEERELIRAHERQHIARKDTRAVAILALARSVFWFNPLLHLVAPMLRLDQEVACDAAVVINRPAARAAYARALLKTQLAATPLPIGCYWPARGQHPLEVRMALLKPRRPTAGSGGRARHPRSIAGPVDAIRP